MSAKHKKLEEEMEEIRKWLNSLSEDVRTVAKQQDTLTELLTEIKMLKNIIKEKDKKIVDLEARIDEIEQYTRMEDLIISGLETKHRTYARVAGTRSKDADKDAEAPADELVTLERQVFQDLGVSVLAAASQGYNVCLFAYGQTGSGKTYTMMGTQDSTGLTPRICQGLFRSQDPLPDGQNSSRVEISFLEIYNERVRDLLGGGEQKKRASLRVREHPDKGPYVQDLSQHVVSDSKQAMELLEAGIANRITAATHNHHASSRSHAIFTVQYTQATLENNRPSETVSRINLVDLAGSERADASSCRDRLTEGSNINKSLVTLGIVISALAQNSQMSSSCQSINSMASEGEGSTAGSHSSSLSGGGGRRHCFIPYRDSVLTWLLKDSLGGNSKTIMIATVSPSANCYNETLSTLRYAAHARNIINQPRVNEDANVRLIRELREEIDRLKNMLLNFETQRDISPSLSDHREATLADIVLQNELKVEQLTKDWSESWGDKEQYGVHSDRPAGVLVNSLQPHLLALDGDVLSTGVVFYHLTEGLTRIGPHGQFKEPQIVLHGGASCEVENDGGVVTLRPLPGCVCLINDREVTEPCRLAQGSVITLGGVHKFRFNHPAEAAALRERRRASEGGMTRTDVEFVPQTPDLSREEAQVKVQGQPGQESSAWLHVDQQQRYVEGLRQEISSEQRRAERELERDQAHIRQQHSEIHQWILQEKCHCLEVEQKVTQEFGVQTDPLLEQLTRLTSDDQTSACPSLIVGARKKAVHEELLKHHALRRAESRLRRKKLQFQLERIARKRHLLEAKRELQRLEKALPPGLDTPECPPVQPKELVTRRYSFSADLVSRLYPQHTPIFRHFLKRNKSTELTSNTSFQCLSSRKWVSDECLNWERTQSCSGALPSRLHQGKGRSSENVVLPSKEETPDPLRKPLLPQRDLSFKNRSGVPATPKMPLRPPMQPLGKENVGSKTNIQNCLDRSQSWDNREGLTNFVAPEVKPAMSKMSGEPPPGGEPKAERHCFHWRHSRDTSHEDSSMMSTSSIKAAVSCGELEHESLIEGVGQRRWNSTETIQTSNWVERHQGLVRCEEGTSEAEGEASDPESLFSLDSLSSAYAMALAEQLKREESEPESEASEMSKDSLVADCRQNKNFGRKSFCQKVVPTYSLVTDPPHSCVKQCGSSQKPKLITTEMDWNQQGSSKNTTKNTSFQHLGEKGVVQSLIDGNEGSENLPPLTDAQFASVSVDSTRICKDLTYPRQGEKNIGRSRVSLSDAMCSSVDCGSESTSTGGLKLHETSGERLISEKEQSDKWPSSAILDTKFKDCGPMPCCDADMPAAGELHRLANPTEQSKVYAYLTASPECNLNCAAEPLRSDSGKTACGTGIGSLKDTETKDDRANHSPQLESSSRKRNKDEQEAFPGSLKIPKRSPSLISNQGNTWSDNNNSNSCNCKEKHNVAADGIISPDSNDVPKSCEDCGLHSQNTSSMRRDEELDFAVEQKAGSRIDYTRRKHVCQAEAICSAIDLRISEVVKEHSNLSLTSNNRSYCSQSLAAGISQNQLRDDRSHQAKGVVNNILLLVDHAKTTFDSTSTNSDKNPTDHDISSSCIYRTTRNDVQNDYTSQQNITNELFVEVIDCSRGVGCSGTLDSGTSKLASDGFHFTPHKHHRETTPTGIEAYVVHSNSKAATSVVNMNYSNKCQGFSQCMHEDSKAPCMSKCEDKASTKRSEAHTPESFAVLEDEKSIRTTDFCPAGMLKNSKSKRLRRSKIQPHSSSDSSCKSSDEDQDQTTTQLKLRPKKQSNGNNSKVKCKMEAIKDAALLRKRLSLPLQALPPRTNVEKTTNNALMHFASSDINPFVRQWQDGEQRPQCCKNPAFGSAADLSYKSPLLTSTEKRITRCSSVDNGLNRQNSPYISHLSTYATSKVLSSTLSSIEDYKNQTNKTLHSAACPCSSHPTVYTTSSSDHVPKGFATNSCHVDKMFSYSSDPESSQRSTNEQATQTGLVLPPIQTNRAPQRKERHKRSHTDVPKTKEGIKESSTWTSMESMSVHLSKLIHSTSDLLGDVQGMRTGRMLNLRRSAALSNISHSWTEDHSKKDCATETVMDVGIQTEIHTEGHQRSKSHELTVTLRVIGAEVVKTETDDNMLTTTDPKRPVLQSGNATVGCRRLLRSAPSRSTNKCTLAETPVYHTENRCRPNGSHIIPTVKNSTSKKAVAFTDRASSPILTVEVQQQVTQRGKNGQKDHASYEDSFTKSSCGSSSVSLKPKLDCDVCSETSESLEMIRKISLKDSEECSPNLCWSLEKRTINHEDKGNAHCQVKRHCVTSVFSPPKYLSVSAPIKQSHSKPDTTWQRSEVVPCDRVCARSPIIDKTDDAASLTASECSTDILLNTKPFTTVSVCQEQVPEDLPMHNKFTNWSGITLQQSRCSSYASNSAMQSDLRSREIERLRKEREQVMASVNLSANAIPLTVELAEAKLHYGRGETDTLLKMMSPRPTDELEHPTSSQRGGLRHSLSVEGLLKRKEEQSQENCRARSLSPCKDYHLSPQDKNQVQQMKPEVTGCQTKQGPVRSDIEQLLRDYGRAREEAMTEIAKARERLRERTEEEKRKLQQQALSAEVKEDPRHRTRISNSTLCTGSSLSLSSGPTSGYNSGNTLQLQHGQGQTTAFLEEDLNVRSPPAGCGPQAWTRRRRATSFGSSSSLSTTYQDITTSLLSRTLAEVRLAASGDLSNLVKGTASAGWRHQGEERGIRVFYRPSSRPSGHAFLAAGELDAPLERLWDVVRQPSKSQAYNRSIRTAWSRPLDGSTQLVYILTEPSSCHLSRPRDFCCISTESKQGGVHVLAMQSAFDKSLPRAGVEAVRGEMMPSCWLLQPIRRGGREVTRAVYLLHVDLGTPSFPSQLLSAVARGHAAVMAALANFADV
ncbi:stAR-related lipid transfer protein 9 [Entelurus aequoreus]|uniref:stAR-related lipid transfer protein 9 n=1 Tax=Entelurus aequoreus TaxID=161455 RepID=UPI002B1DAFD2|nr:stAR-related lipid transfer protein 9 [Entelurus aequoreus]